MFHFKIIKYFYIFLSILSIITPHKISIIELLPGILLMWFTYFLFTSTHNTNNVILKFNISDFNFKKAYKLLLLFIYFPFYVLFIKFYTGQSLFSTINNFLTGTSNYAIYQDFFITNDLNTFSLAKIPFIATNGVLKFFYYAFVFYFMINSKKRSFLDFLLIIILTLTNIMVALSRGTSFELFEIFLLFITSYIIYRKSIGFKTAINFKMVMLFSFFALSFLLYFSYNIQNRFGSKFNDIMILDFNYDSFINKLYPPLAVSFFLLHGYFLFGLNYMSIVIVELSRNLFSLFSLIIPNGVSLFGIDKNYRNIVEKHIDIGAKWTPDISIYLDSFGLIITSVIIILFGKIFM
jgi:hypothetical protein